jgi:hypothetical protein
VLDPDAASDDALRESALSGHPPLVHLTLTMLDALRPEVARMPGVAADAYDLADRYWRRGDGNDDDLLAVRVACWQYTDALNRDNAAREGRAYYLTRAVICVLYPPSPEGQDDLAETADWFCQYLAHAKAATHA